MHAISGVQECGGCVRLAISHIRLLWCERHSIDCTISAGLSFQYELALQLGGIADILVEE